MTYPLRSWLVKVRSANQASRSDGWGDRYVYHPVVDHYVIARTKKSAIRQAKRMAGYRNEKLETGGNVLRVEQLDSLEV